MTVGRVQIAIFCQGACRGLCEDAPYPEAWESGAADLQRRMIERAVDTAVGSGVGPVSIWCAPDCRREPFPQIASRCGIALFDQVGTDLGERMLAAFEQLTPAGPLLLIGTDCPILLSSHLRACAEGLERGQDAAFLPTEDGGYALIGLSRPVPALFAEMPWGTEAVMLETRARAWRLGLIFSEPAFVWDVDTPTDYDRAVGLGLIEPG